MLYATAHPVSKRNMMYILHPHLPRLTAAAWAPEVPKPARGTADQFLKVRLGGIPAGVRKAYVTVEACKRVAANGLLCAIPGVGALPKMNSVLEKVKEEGVAAHVGATYYLRHTGQVPHVVEQNRGEFKTALVYSGAYLR